MELNFDDNILWVLGLLALVFFLFPQKTVKTNVEERAEEKYQYIYRRKTKERRRLVY